MKEFLKKFGVTDNNIYNLENPSKKDISNVYRNILKRLIEGLEKKPVQEDYLVIHVFAGHGV